MEPAATQPLITTLHARYLLAAQREAVEHKQDLVQQFRDPENWKYTRLAAPANRIPAHCFWTRFLTARAGHSGADIRQVIEQLEECTSGAVRFAVENADSVVYIYSPTAVEPTAIMSAAIESAAVEKAAIGSGQDVELEREISWIKSGYPQQGSDFVTVADYFKSMVGLQVKFDLQQVADAHTAAATIKLPDRVIAFERSAPSPASGLAKQLAVNAMMDALRRDTDLREEIIVRGALERVSLRQSRRNLRRVMRESWDRQAAANP